jgi:hypothetical protein
MTSIESEARGIRERHESDHANSGAIDLVEFCVLCDHRWPCADRLAADAITQALPKIVKALEDIRDRCRPIPLGTPAENCAYQDAVAALASLTGQDKPEDRVHRTVAPDGYDGEAF